jgi:hypothetical protein
MSAKPATSEACDLCHTSLHDEHQHLLEYGTRKIECVCDACAILFSGEQQKYRRIPRRVKYLPGFRMTDAQWDGLTIPIGIAFLYRSSTSNKVVALYPSPAGPVESLLALETWDEIVADNPILGDMQADVEGLLVYRIGAAKEHYIAPIDECFKLAGLIRMRWKGLSGGAEVWEEVGKFLENLKQRSG